MSCYRGRRNRGSCGDFGDVGGVSKDCVKDTVRRILDAQKEVAEEGLHDCRTSCDRSIEDLLSPGMEERGRHTTIPFMLTCRQTCKIWVGTGFCGHGGDMGNHGHFYCIESPIFKVQGFVGGSDNCVRLELLLPVDQKPNESMQENHGSDVCSDIGHCYFKNLRRTGICITVDLDCFCGISCLPATTPYEYNS